MPHPLTNFEGQKYCQIKPKFNYVYSRNNLPKIKNGVYLINFNENESIQTHWIALYVNDSFRVSYIPKEIEKFLENKNIITYIQFNNVCILLHWIY